MSVSERHMSRKSYLSKFYVDVQNLGNTASVSLNELSQGFTTQFIVPVECRLNKAYFGVAGADQTASNGVTVTLTNVTRSANIFSTADGNRLQSQVSVVDYTSVDWVKGTTVTRTATNTFTISAMSLLSLTASATAGSANLCAAFEFDVNPRRSRDFQSNGGLK